MTDQVTNMFPAETLPVRSGVYKTLAVDEDGEAMGDWGFSYFDSTDRIWGCAYASVDEAWKQPDYEYAHQQKLWFGLTEEPKV